MTCSVYLPSSCNSEGSTNRVPCLMYLSGVFFIFFVIFIMILYYSMLLVLKLTCTDENVCQKSGAFRYLSQRQLGFIAPDTSPRGAGIAGESDSWDFGVGAGFYLDATQNPWAENYKMYSYITKELPSIIANNFPTLDQSRMGISGHSMGGHGALTIALKNPSLFKSVSAFSPICNPSHCPWGIKAFNGYLGDDNESWKQYDATDLMRSGGQQKFDNILIDVGDNDNFFKSQQLLPEEFQKACDSVGQVFTYCLIIMAFITSGSSCMYEYPEFVFYFCL